MANLYSQFTYDNDLLMKATGAVAVDGGHTIKDLGAGHIDADMVIDVSALVTNGASPESYEIIVQGSNDATMATGKVALARLKLGAATPLAPGADAATGTGRFVLPFRNEQNGTSFRYVRLYTDVGGTAPSINYMAFIAKD